jgi:membrane protein CcdC involved in cytochrome C biogenesis
MDVSNYLVHVLIEALVVGFLFAFFGLFVSTFMFKRKNETYRDNAKIFFLTGMIVHIVCEVSGINSWYIKNGAVLKNK